MNTDLMKLTANTIRGLSIDAIQKANSGHPGLPMGMADVASVLFNEHLKFNPKNPNWFDRDRFVLSGGHGSMLLYSLLHLYGYDLSMDDIKEFRQWHSKTPGHPEVQDTAGVETTTGPLGQGLANAVGMALAESIIAAKYNTDTEIINHYTFTMAGDGDLEEGISHEVCSFAGHNKLGKLILFYDSNHITIDGNTSLTYSDDVKKRFESYHWQVLEINGQNYNEIHKAISKAKAENDKPTIIICNTTIGFGSPNKAGTSGIHGSPLGEEEIILTKENLGISTEKFYVPQEVYDFTQETIKKGIEAERIWNINFESYKDNNKDAAKELQNLIEGKIPDFKISEFEAGTKLATRASSGKVIEELAEQLPMLIGGSADLTPSNKTKAKSQSEYSPNNRWGNYIHYGIREFGMAAVMNGIALHGGLIPYGGTFFVFSDYMRSAMRMAALMGIRVIYVLTHDSIGLGEDGPTHQPVEHLSSLRVIPNMTVFRPMDANETAAAWKLALNNTEGPSTLVLTRQGLTTVKRNGRDFADISNAEKGAYAVSDDVDFDVILMASGSEVEIALEAKERLNKDGIEVRVISFLSQELFDKQSDDYKKTILPSYADKRIAVEAGSSMSWYKYVGDKGKIIGIDNFGASAPYEVLYEKYGITAEAVYNAAKKLLK
ncbi:MAG: transketolase [Bacteroidetes bacterium]|nr:MAG: transketolase [Bacteroidota bacterium]